LVGNGPTGFVVCIFSSLAGADVGNCAHVFGESPMFFGRLLLLLAIAAALPLAIGAAHGMWTRLWPSPIDPSHKRRPTDEPAIRTDNAAFALNSDEPPPT
jgi:hypothetical protein